MPPKILNDSRRVNKWTVSPSGASSSPWNNTNSITFYNEGTYNVACRIISPCGYGSAASMIVTVVRNGGSYFSLSPNPATDVVTVQLEEESPQNNVFSIRSVNKTSPRALRNTTVERRKFAKNV